MQQFQHKMRTSQHTKSVQSIMTRSHSNLFNSKHSFKKITSQGENITTYLRKFQINRENENLAKRILLCQSQHSRDKYNREWQNIRKFLQVRSNFKKTLHASEPKIFKFEPILGRGKLKVDFQVQSLDMPLEFCNRKNLYRFVFMLQSHQIQPDQKLIPMQYASTYQAIFYAPLLMKKKKVVGKMYQVNQLNCYQAARFQVDFGEVGEQKSLVFNKVGKAIGSIGFILRTEAGLKRLKKKSLIEKENLPVLSHTQDCTMPKVNYCSEAFS